MILNNSGEFRQPCLGPNLRRKVVSVSPLVMILAVNLLVGTFYQVEKVVFYSLFAENCYHK